MSAHKLEYAITVGPITKTYPLTYNATSGDTLIDGEEVATAQTDFLINLAIDVSTVKSFFIVSNVAITVETNSNDATGGNTLNLLAGQPYVWHTTDYNTFKLTADVTKMYITNASGSTAKIYCYCLQDPTP